jgi:hypothetical protein
MALFQKMNIKIAQAHGIMQAKAMVAAGTTFPRGLKPFVFSATFGMTEVMP